jgi:hypothetical protein
MPNREFAKQRFCLEAQNPETGKPYLANHGFVKHGIHQKHETQI